MTVNSSVMIGAGQDHTCAARKTGQVVCWGRGAEGQLSPGRTEDSDRPIAVNGTFGQVTQLALGELHSCALQSNRIPLCWGRNQNGQTGNLAGAGTLLGQAVLPVMKLEPAVELVAGALHTCARTATSDVFCWGNADDGQLGAGVSIASVARLRVKDIRGALAVGSGDFHTCAAVAGGQISCWGRGATGQLGDGGSSLQRIPVRGPRIDGVVRLSGGLGHTCALRSNGRVMCWGDNQRGQLGGGASSQSAVPAAVVDIP